MFVKAELKFCHACRILKVRCQCYDYSQLEAEYQEKDRVLRYAALHEFPVEEVEGDDENAASSPSTEPAIGTPSSNMSTGPSTYMARQIMITGNAIHRAAAERSPTRISSPMAREASGPSQSAGDTSITIAGSGGQAFLVAQSPQATSFDFNAGMGAATGTVAHIAAAQMSPSPVHARQSTPMPTPTSTHTPTLVKFELRTVIMAREKISTHSRRWQCRFGLTDNPADPVCKREDDNMETIRRHYGREHGSHRFHKRPALRIRCSHCDLEYDKQRPPMKCPGCKVDRGIWLREIFAVIEVPVPLDTQDQASNTRSNGPSSGGGAADPSNGSSSDNVGSSNTSRRFGTRGDLRGTGNPSSPAAGTGGPSSGRPSGADTGQVHRMACRRRVDNLPANVVTYDPATNMPECYNDIVNNTTALPVMAPPSIFVADGIGPRPTSSSSASTAQSQVQSPFTQGFFTLNHGLPVSPAVRMSYPSPPSPASNASSSTYETEPTPVFPSYDQLGVASVSGEQHAGEGMVMSGVAASAVTYGVAIDGVGNIGVANSTGVVDGVRDVAVGINNASSQITSYTEMLNMAIDDAPAQVQAVSTSAQSRIQPPAASISDIQMLISLTPRQAAQAAPSPAPPTTLEAPMCNVESEYFYFND
ncbi:hypothetical protein SEUCBS139899_007007 [Sporothrix eucalyptigena]